MDETATPQLIPDFTPGAEKSWIKHLNKKLEGKSPVAEYKGADVYDVGDTQNRYIVLKKDGGILYFVSAKQIKLGKLRFGRQVLVWRNYDLTSSYAATGFAHHVFFDILLKEYGKLITDTQQTSRGKAFWFYAIDKAFDKNANVYYFDTTKQPLHLEKLTGTTDLARLEPEAWGTDAKHKLKFFIISKSTLALK